MPVYFEGNFSYPIPYKQSMLDLLDGRELHYEVSTNQQQQRFWISFTMVDTRDGSVVTRNDLSKLFFTYDKVLDYVPYLRQKLTENKKDKQLEEMQNHFAEIRNAFAKLDGAIKFFQRKYNLETYEM